MFALYRLSSIVVMLCGIVASSLLVSLHVALSLPPFPSTVYMLADPSPRLNRVSCTLDLFGQTWIAYLTGACMCTHRSPLCFSSFRNDYSSVYS
ncbi:hypothetical protein V8D89_005893 [Ganoderma adspersum]